MRFSRIGEHTIKCIITEEEIGDLGYTLDEIMSNGERTQEFMNYIFDLAEQEFQTKFDMGIKTVRADFMSDHTLSLTFSEHPGSGAVMEQIKNLVNSLIGSIPKEKWAAMQEAARQKQDEDAQTEAIPVIVQFVFKDMDLLIRFAKLVRVEPLPWNALYKYREEYRLLMDLTACSKEDAARLSSLISLIDEYAQDVYTGADKRAFILEHGKPILKERAIEQLREL